jgi:hypothetical protein
MNKRKEDEDQAGQSKCPICGKVWAVTPLDDCFLPACGCYGSDTSRENPARPCESCGLQHALTCAKPKEAAA